MEFLVMLLLTLYVILFMLGTIIGIASCVYLTYIVFNEIFNAIKTAMLRGKDVSSNE